MFKVGDIVWHPQYKRGEVAYSAGTDMQVMFDDPRFNLQISTDAPAYISSEHLADALREELDKAEEELKREFEAQPELPQEEKDKIRKEKMDGVVRQNESLKENTRKADVDGHVVWWDADHPWEPPLLPNGQPDPKYKYPVMSGYYLITKGTQPLGWHPDKKNPGKLKFHPIEEYLDMNLQHTTSGAKFRVRIYQRELPVLPAARSVPADSVSLLMEDEDQFGGFFDHSAQ